MHETCAVAINGAFGQYKQQFTISVFVTAGCSAISPAILNYPSYRCNA